MIDFELIIAGLRDKKLNNFVFPVFAPRFDQKSFGDLGVLRVKGLERQTGSDPSNAQKTFKKLRCIRTEKIVLETCDILSIIVRDQAKFGGFDKPFDVAQNWRNSAVEFINLVRKCVEFGDDDFI